MFWFVLGHFVAFLVDLVLGTRPGDRDKDLPILVLRHQLRLAQRQRPRPPRLTVGPSGRLDQYLLLFTPDTILSLFVNHVSHSRPGSWLATLVDSSISIGDLFVQPLPMETAQCRS